jgi:hypothetical protein
MYRNLPAYLVTLRDKTDTWRTFTVTGRFGMVRLYRGHGVVTRLGFVNYDMLRALGFTWPPGHSARE